MAVCWVEPKAAALPSGLLLTFAATSFHCIWANPSRQATRAHVGEHLVPMPHFGLVLALPDWQAMATRLTDAGIAFFGTLDAFCRPAR